MEATNSKVSIKALHDKAAEYSNEIIKLACADTVKSLRAAATTDQQLYIIKSFLKSQEDPILLEKIQEYLLNYAVMGNELELCKLLLNINPNLIKYEGESHCSGVSLLHIAFSNCHREMCHFLIERGGDVHRTRPKTKETPLHIAAKFGWLEVSEQLLAKGAAIDAVTSDGQTPLHWAGEGGFSETYLFLLKCGAHSEAVDNQGRTALEVAEENNQSRLCYLAKKLGNKFTFDNYRLSNGFFSTLFCPIQSPTQNATDTFVSPGSSQGF